MLIRVLVCDRCAKEERGIKSESATQIFKRVGWGNTSAGGHFCGECRKTGKHGGAPLTAWAEIKDLLAEGLNPRQIAERRGVTRASVMAAIGAAAVRGETVPQGGVE